MKQSSMIPLLGSFCGAFLFVWFMAHKQRQFEKREAQKTYTVDAMVWRHTNCVFVGDCPSGNGDCKLVKYVDNGVTNEFHAWMVPVHVVTNK